MIHLSVNIQLLLPPPRRCGRWCQDSSESYDSQLSRSFQNQLWRTIQFLKNKKSLFHFIFRSRPRTEDLWGVKVNRCLGGMGRSSFWLFYFSSLLKRNNFIFMRIKTWKRIIWLPNGMRRKWMNLNGSDLSWSLHFSHFLGRYTANRMAKMAMMMMTTTTIMMAIMIFFCHFWTKTKRRQNRTM